MTREQLRRRNAAIRRAWEDPLRRAIQSEMIKRVRAEGPFRGRNSDSRTYMREYMRRRRATEL